MNRKVITIIIVIIAVALIAVAVIYAPNMLQAMLRMHKIPQH